MPRSESPPTPSARVRWSARDPALLAAGTLGVVLTALWTWWGLESGGFFESVAYPGAILLYLTLSVVMITAPVRVRLRGMHVVAIAAMGGLVAWTLASLAWTPSRDVALEDASRLLIYAASFLAGLVLANLLRGRVTVAVGPYCVAGAIVATVTATTLLGVESSLDVLDESGTLDYPFGYRNATAAFFVTVALACAGLAAARTTPLLAAAPAAGVAALCVTLVVLSQSRGSVIGGAVGALVLLALSRSRLRLLAVALCIGIPVAIATPALLEPFRVAEDGLGAEAVLESAAKASLFAAAAAVAASAGTLGLLNRLAPKRRLGTLARRSLAAAAVAICLTGGLAFAIAVGSPVGWVEDQVSSRFTEEGGGSSRFVYTGGRNRGDFWRVSLSAAEENPVIGDGSGSFRQRYALERRSQELPLDAHSLPLETLGELGIVGLALLLVAAAAAAGAVVRSLRAGPEAATLGAIALAAGAYYAAHASIDWTWSFPGVTAPVVALLGAACAPGAASSGAVPAPLARSLGVALAVVSVAMIPPFLSARLLGQGKAEAAADPEGARETLERAAELNPFADLPYLVAADIARRQGKTSAALGALARARRREPGEWVNYALAAQALKNEDPRRAVVELRRARELNPAEEDLDVLERQIRRPSR